MEKNKVQFNLKNVHYALLSTGTDGKITFGVPVAVLGAVSLTLDPQGSSDPFYADGIVYYQATVNNGYAGDMEMARIPDQMLQDIWKFILNNDNVITENAEEEPEAFALLYQIDGDKNNDFYCLYNCTGTRPGIGGVTDTNTRTVHTRKTSISATPLPDGRVMARTTSETSTEIKENWFKEVYQGTVASTEAETQTES